MTRLPGYAAAALLCAGCAADHDKSANPAAAAAHTTGCIAGGGGFLHAQVRGAVVADLDWSNTQMECAGGPRPEGRGLRLTFAGELPRHAAADAARQLRFIFGVDQQDGAPGAVQALPTNLTVILEGEQQLYATRGAGNCAVELLERTPLAGAAGKSRVHARGYCLGPATNIAGDARVLVPTFEFTGVADTEVP
ncbi:MAG TPA: hypothetical protein VMH77_04430 [Steroidobacteraceae bacterium]|nr:hypothetical protein [Steroidobacteraceae bacterium]